MDINNLIEKQAVKAMKQKPVVKEFGFLLSIFILLKLLTSVISIIAGFSFVKNTILQLTTNIFLSVVISVFILFTIEFITQISLQRLFKFTLKKQVKYVVLMSVIVAIFFFISSYLSLQGIAIITSHKKDLTAAIVDKYKTVTEQTKQDYQDKINFQKEQINTIKKQTWHGKLSMQHVKQITDINNVIIQLQKEEKEALKKINEQKQKELNSNKINTKNTVQKYIWIVAIIMLVQLLSNLFLNYFYLLILKERNEYLTDFINTEQATIRDNIIDLYKNMFRQNNSAMISGLQRGLLESQVIINQATKRPLGFANENRINENRINENRINETQIKSEPKTKPEPKTGNKICPVCGKEFTPRHHKQIYCSDACRIKNWETKTGRKLKLKKKKII